MPSSKPLSGIRIVEIGNSVAAPYSGFILAQLGAEVIKVEAPEGGDHARGWGPPFWEGIASYFAALNRGKLGITVDLAVQADRDRLVELIVERADAVICNLRPGLAQERGLSAKHLLARKPSLIYSEIGAFGRGGPLETRPGYDPLMQAYGGLMSITGESEQRPPIRVGVSIVDMGAGLWSAVSILSALLERQRTGAGGLVETSLFETSLAWAAVPLASALMEPRQMKPQGSGSAGIVPYQAFKALDGWLVIAAGNDGLFAKLGTALGLPKLNDARFATNRARVTLRDELIPIIEEDVARRTVLETRLLLDEHGVPNAPVQRIDQVIRDEHAIALGIIQQGPKGAPTTVGLPVRFDGIRPGYDTPPPRLGQHTEEVFSKGDSK